MTNQNRLPLRIFGVVVGFALVVGANTAIAQKQHNKYRATSAPRTLDGSNNNPNFVDRGRANTVFLRLSEVMYDDGIAVMLDGPNTRYISNRIFNDVAQNFFSQNLVTQWAAAWGQFVDHSTGLRDQGEGESAPIAFDSFDPLEEFHNDLGVISFNRTPAAPDTGINSPRDQINTVSSYLDAFAVYGGTQERLEWMREGPVDGDMSNNSARMMTTSDNYLPRAFMRDAETAPSMAIVGALRLDPNKRVIAGDVRANENIALTAIHTLMVREHNRIVDALPARLSEEDKFEIARRVVGAMQQYITYNEFLPAMGLRLKRYRGYRPRVNASISNEFAAVGFRAHSMVHGEIEIEAEASDFSQEQLNVLRDQGIEVEETGADVEIAIPLSVAYANPDLVEEIGLGHIFKGLAGESQYRNDEQIDNQLRSVLFQIPRPAAERPADCLDGENLPQCFAGVTDLGAIDIERGRDHGIALYNNLRRVYGLNPINTFTELTGEATDEFPQDILDAGIEPIDNPDILLFDELRDIDGAIIQPGTDAAEGDAVSGTRRTTLAARLKAIYGSVDNVDAFVGMSAEPHLDGTDFGELQYAIWKKQFEDLRDGDRYFYLNDPVLKRIKRDFGITYKLRMAEVVGLNTDVDADSLPTNVFSLGDVTPPRQQGRPHRPRKPRTERPSRRKSR